MIFLSTFGTKERYFSPNQANNFIIRPLLALWLIMMGTQPLGEIRVKSVVDQTTVNIIILFVNVSKENAMVKSFICITFCRKDLKKNGKLFCAVSVTV